MLHRRRPHRRRSARRATILARAPAARAIDDHSGKLVLPGFIDTHIHYPQTRVIGSYGAQLLEWLQKYTFVEEQKFADPAPCRRASRASFSTNCSARARRRRWSIAPCIRNRSTRSSPRAERRGARMIAGKVMMDRNAPPGADRRSAARLRREQGADRALARARPARLRDHAALRRSPRPRRSSRRPARWRANIPSAYMQTHLDENLAEIAFVKRAVSLGARPISTSTSATACSARARCSAIASISKTREVAALARSDSGRRLLPDLEPVPRLRPVRQEAARRRPACASRSRPTSAAAPAIRCCRPPTKPTRCCR